MKNKDWLFSVCESSRVFGYYAQHKSSCLSYEQILQSDLTRDEAMEMLSLVGEPIRQFDVCYSVHVYK
jgi:hypothetical protein